MHLRQLDSKLDSKCFLVIKDIHLKYIVFTELMNQKRDHAKELIKFNST